MLIQCASRYIIFVPVQYLHGYMYAFKWYRYMLTCASSPHFVVYIYYRCRPAPCRHSTSTLAPRHPVSAVRSSSIAPRHPVTDVQSDIIAPCHPMSAVRSNSIVPRRPVSDIRASCRATSSMPAVRLGTLQLVHLLPRAAILHYGYPHRAHLVLAHWTSPYPRPHHPCAAIWTCHRHRPPHLQG